MDPLGQLHNASVVFLNLLDIIHHLLLIFRNISLLSGINGFKPKSTLRETNTFLKRISPLFLILELRPIDPSISSLMLLLNILKWPQPKVLGWWIPWDRMQFIIAQNILVYLYLLEHFRRLLFKILILILLKSILRHTVWQKVWIVRFVQVYSLVSLLRQFSPFFEGFVPVFGLV